MFDRPYKPNKFCYRFDKRDRLITSGSFPKDRNHFRYESKVLSIFRSIFRQSKNESRSQTGSVPLFRPTKQKKRLISRPIDPSKNKSRPRFEPTERTIFHPTDQSKNRRTSLSRKRTPYLRTHCTTRLSGRQNKQNRQLSDSNLRPYSPSYRRLAAIDQLKNKPASHSLPIRSKASPIRDQVYRVSSRATESQPRATDHIRILSDRSRTSLVANGLCTAVPPHRAIEQLKNESYRDRTPYRRNLASPSPRTAVLSRSINQKTSPQTSSAPSDR